MRGQRLFLRPVESGDAAALAAFAAAHGAPPPPASGILAKVVGDLVAILGLEPAGRDLIVTQLFVQQALRRKRIGRAMLEEGARTARGLDAERLVVAPDAGLPEAFLARVGFEHEGGRWIRRIEAATARLQRNV